MTTALDLVVNAFWHHVAPLSAIVIVWVLAVALIQRLLPRTTWPELRFALWLLVLLRLVIPASALPSLPLAEERSSPDAAETQIVAVPGFLPPTMIRSGAIVTPRDSVPAILRGADPETLTLWAEALALIWFGGAAVFLGLQAVWHVRTVGRWTSRGIDVPRPLAEILKAESDRLGIRRPPPLVLSPEVTAPLAAGVIRPAIYLPADLAVDLPRELLAPVILHELAHVRRRDAWLGLACLLVHAVYWFHPAVWYARRRVHALIEPCCDRTVVRALQGDVSGYRRALLHFARDRLLHRRPATAGTLLQHSFLAPESLMLLRLRLLEDSFDRPWRRRATTAATLMVLAAASLPAARAAGHTVELVKETLVERPPGCLTLRYMVLRAMSLEDAPQPPREDSP